MSLVSLRLTFFPKICPKAQISKTLIPGDLGNDVATPKSQSGQCRTPYRCHKYLVLGWSYRQKKEYRDKEQRDKYVTRGHRVMACLYLTAVCQPPPPLLSCPICSSCSCSYFYSSSKIPSFKLQVYCIIYATCILSLYNISKIFVSTSQKEMA